MTLITAKFVFDTPGFVGGATPKKQSEMQVAPLLSQLRFWWRALFAAHCRNNAGDELRQREAQLFGHSASEESDGANATGGQGAFTAYFSGAPLFVGSEEELDKHDLPTKLLTYKKGNKKGKPPQPRPAIPKGSRFKIHFLFKSADSELQDQFLQAIKALGMLGGVGYAWRRGFGALRLEKLQVGGREEVLPIANSTIYKNAITACLTEYEGIQRFNRGNFAHFCQDSIIFLKKYPKTKTDKAHKYFATMVDRQSSPAGAFFGGKGGGRRPSPFAIQLRKLGDHSVIVATCLYPRKCDYQVANFLEKNNFEKLTPPQNND